MIGNTDHIQSISRRLQQRVKSYVPVVRIDGVAMEFHSESFHRSATCESAFKKKRPRGLSEKVCPKCATIRSAAFPSQSGGNVRSFTPPLESAWSASRTIAELSRGTKRFVPNSIVTGRSVFGRTVRHGTPK
jgi:hypothetical protein